MAKDSAFDVKLAGHGFVLARSGQLGRGGRAWQETTVGASIARQSPSDMAFGNQESTIEIPAVFRGTHLGYGDADYRAEGRYRYSTNVDARFEEGVIPGPKVNNLTIGGSANVNGFFEQAGSLYCIAGQLCKKIAGDYTITTAKDFGAGKAATDAVVYNGVAYVGMGYAEAFWTRTANADPTLGWTQATALYMGKIARFSHALWASATASTIKKVTGDPTVAADWSYAYQVGDTESGYRDITSMAELADLLYIGKSDGLYALGTPNQAQPSTWQPVMLTPEVAAYASSLNCVNMRAWHGSMWVPHIRGLLNYRHLGGQGFGITPATPGTEVDSDNPVHGQITAMAGDNKWLYAALLTTDGDTYIMAGREAREGETQFGMLLWHPIAVIESKQVDVMHISGLWSNPHLFLGKGADAAYIVLPRFSSNPYHDSNSTYSLTGSIYYPAHFWAVPTTTKIWKSLELIGEDLTSARYVDVYYRVNAGAWVSLGRANLSPRYVLAFPDKGVSGEKIEIRLDFTLPSATNPLMVKTVVLRGVERPRTIDLIQMTVRCADQMSLRQQRRQTNRTGADMLAELKALAISNEAVILEDLIGAKRYVLVLSAVRQLPETQQQGDLPREFLVQVNMVEFQAAETTAETGAWFVVGTSLVGSTTDLVR